MVNVVRKRRKKVLVGLSGGVDSAVSALLLREQGHDVTGVMMAIYDGPPGPSRRNACYDRGEAEDIASAADLAARLDIPFHVFDCAGQFRSTILAYFRDAYLSGKTPNPCIRCNQMLKFGLLPLLAEQKGLEHDWFATGHYARAEFSRRYRRYVLRRAVDGRKDQSYFLYRLTQEQLSRASLPLGEMRKEEVRALAAQRGLPMHDKPDSQDFYSGDYTELLGVGELPGDIVDTSGKVVGRHPGFWHFTPGQRKGLGIAAPSPFHVLRVDAERNTVVVGSPEESLRSGCLLDDVCFNLPLAVTGPDLRARIRSSQEPVAVRVRPDADGRIAVDFAEPQRGIAPGQSLVLYLDDLVTGGGIIA
jgi:tRNA-specific 2-thiouridylase